MSTSTIELVTHIEMTWRGGVKLMKSHCEQDSVGIAKDQSLLQCGPNEVYSVDHRHMGLPYPALLARSTHNVVPIMIISLLDPRISINCMWFCNCRFWTCRPQYK